MNRQKFLKYEWDAIAGIIAAVIAIILHLLHIVDEHTILLILLALVGLLFINFLRHAEKNEVTAGKVAQTAHRIASIQAAIAPSDVILVGPRHLRAAHEHFLLNLSGETLWFNVCLSMYRTQALFDALLKPVLENTKVTSIQFVLDKAQQQTWQQTVVPMIAACNTTAKIREPLWRDLNNPVSFILGDSQLSGETEALLSFWGAPFMAQTVEHEIPRYIFHVQRRSELLPHLEELVRMVPE
ncbi:MAG: hypothetical protein K9K86_00250 [Pseudomonadales bacterium]|nr:hypothetical protein [Pseudomonadales bacterium]